jgi:outer membrane protein W
MKPSWLGLTLAFVLAAAYSMPAFAEDQYPARHREYETSLFLGPSFIRDFQFPTRVSGDGQETSRTVGMHYADGYQFGVRITQHLGNYWAAELGYSFANQPLRFTNLSPTVQSLSLSHWVHRFPYNVSFTPKPLSQRFRPYATVGLGAALFYLPGSSKDAALEQGVKLRDSWQFALNWGGGLKYLIQDQFAIRLDATDHVSYVPSYGLPHSAQITNGQYTPGMAQKGMLHHWQLNLGFAIQFDDF